MAVLLHNIAILYTAEYDTTSEHLRSVTIPDAAVIWENDTIIWRGRQADIPSHISINKRIDAQRNSVTPGFIDAHTHLCFGGFRQDEFVRKLQGENYISIAKAGGGIVSTVKATRETAFEQLLQKSSGFLDDMSHFGVTTIEAKSGYGLNLETELKQLQVYHSLNQSRSDIDIISTCLGAHTFPPEFKENPSSYVDFLISKLIPEIAQKNLAEFFDIFVETGAFNISQADIILNKATAFGFKLKLHVDQLSDGGGAELAARHQAVSADHLEYISDRGIKALKSSGTIPVSLPLATIYLNQSSIPARKLLDAGLPLVIATDFNPGSAPSHNIQLTMWLGCVLQRMTPHEVLLAVTNHAARAIDRESVIGTITPGKKADLLILTIPGIDEWMYNYAANPVKSVIKSGQKVV